MPPRSNDHLFEIVTTMPTDFAPYGERLRVLNGVIQPDCSDGCKFFGRLAGVAGIDWGVCSGKGSPRSAMLTFTDFDCPNYVQRDLSRTDEP
jgi:hypothetical protein